jgi:hypothetical protein
MILAVKLTWQTAFNAGRLGRALSRNGSARCAVAGAGAAGTRAGRFLNDAASAWWDIPTKM